MPYITKSILDRSAMYVEKHENYFWAEGKVNNARRYKYNNNMNTISFNSTFLA